MLNAASNAFLNTLFSAPAAAGRTNPLGSEAPRPLSRLLFLRDMPKVGSQLSLDFSSLLGPLFYTWLSQMLLPVMVGLLVYEKARLN